MAAVVLPLCLEAQIPDKSPLILVLNGTPFTIREGLPIPKDGEEPASGTCYVTTQVGTWHVRLSAEEALRQLVPDYQTELEVPELVRGLDQPLKCGTITAESIPAGSTTSKA